MDFFQALVLGLLQGIFEWLPVSSQGQIMALAMGFFRLSAEEALRYALVLHTGTLLAAIVYFRKEIFELLQLKDVPLLKFILIATASSAITALPCYFILEKAIKATNAAKGIFYFLLLIGLLLIINGLIQRRRASKLKPRLDSRNAFFLGIAQGFSVLPGISRSGITTSVLLFEGFNPENAFRLSFILSIPSILLAELAFYASAPAFDFNASLSLLVAFISGLFLIGFLLRVAKKINFARFCIAFGIIYVLLAIFESGLFA